MYFQKKFLYCILIFSFYSQQTVYAWNGFYHRVIAQIAYDQLNLQQKRQINAWLNPPDSKIKMRFLTASIWPDYIKGRGNKTFNDWHFINLPFIQDAMIAKPIHSKNIVWALQQNINSLNNSSINADNRAFHLRFLLHLVGDIHQPLHCSVLYNQYFPRGDGGGNAYKILGKRENNLHALWDAGLYLGRDHFSNQSKQILKLARRLEAQYPQHYFSKDLKEKSIAKWAQESYYIAVTKAYRIKQYSVPSQAYLNVGQQVVAERITLAGYRLAILLQELKSPL